MTDFLANGASTVILKLYSFKIPEVTLLNPDKTAISDFKKYKL